MAIEWGAWEGSGNEMRVGIEVTWETITHSETVATATVKIYTQNNFSWDDDQALNYGGSISGSTSFHNGQGDGVTTLRATKTCDYTYGGSSYGTSPGTRTFSATLSGAFNGITPSKSVTTDIPARPIAAPAAPTSVSFSRVSDTSTKISWVNNDTAGEPWESITLQRSVNGGAWVTVSSSIGGSATSYTNATSPDWKIDYQVLAKNSAGSSSYASSSSFIFTTPDAPTTPGRSGANGANQTASWVNNVAYSEYQTEVWRSTNGTWALLTTVAAGTTSYVDTYPASHPADKFKYKFRSKTTTGAQGTLYSAYTAETTETSGQTAPSLAPTGLSPNGLTVDPTLAQRLSWTFQPGIGGDTQAQYTLQHRLAGTATWTTVGPITSTNQFYDLPANTYAEQAIVEWQVSTKGADPSFGPYSEPVTFLTAITAIAPDPVKLPVVMDLFTGQLEASTTAYELRNYVMRAQSQLMGGGIRAVSASYGLTWSQRFITIGLGRSASTFPNGHHDILNPYGWANSLKEVTSNVAKLTFSVSTNRARVGDTITVSGCGAPFDGTFVVRESGTNYVKYDLVNANIASTAAAGATFCTIKGHGGVADSFPNAGIVTLGSWESLWYELPFGWGGGSTPKKNGVVTVTNKSLTSNVATLTVVAPHYFAIGDRITVAISDAVFDGSDLVITAMTGNTISYAKTNANVSSTAATGTAKPSGKDTFFGNFHKTVYTADFVVPDNWILLAMRNADGATVEWGTGDAVDPGFDSDSPVLKQVILNSTTDVTSSGGNKPALRIGSITGAHLRIDGNELQAMATDTTVASFQINGAGGGGVNLGKAGSNDVQSLSDFVIPNFPTTASAANVNMGTGGKIFRVTSTRRSKKNIRNLEVDVDAILNLEPRLYNSKNEQDDPDKDFVGFIAEDAADLGLEHWVDRDDQGEIQSFFYSTWVVALQAVARSQREQIRALEARVAAIEGN